MRSRLCSLLLALLSLLPSAAWPDVTGRFVVSIENLTPYDLSPGGYVIHGPDFELFSMEKTASAGVQRLCASGTTPDFLFYARKEQIQKAFGLIGGVPALKTVTIALRSDGSNSYLSFIHKVSFTDDTCVGGRAIELASGTPATALLTAFDAGIKENLKSQMPRHPLLVRLNPGYWTSRDTLPPQRIQPSPLFKEMPIARVVVRPYEARDKHLQLFMSVD